MPRDVGRREELGIRNRHNSTRSNRADTRYRRQSQAGGIALVPFDDRLLEPCDTSAICRSCSTRGSSASRIARLRLLLAASSTRAATARSTALPCFMATPNSARCAHNAFYQHRMLAQHAAPSNRCSIRTACGSSLFTGTNRIDPASMGAPRLHNGSGVAMSFFCRLT